MAERRYSFRYSLPEGCVLLLSLLLTSFLVFLFGVYVGKEVEAHKAAQQTRTVRLPITTAAEPSSRLSVDALPATPSSPGEKPTASPSLPPPVLAPPIVAQRSPLASSEGTIASRSLPTPASPAATVAQSKPLLPPPSRPVTPVPIESQPLPSSRPLAASVPKPLSPSAVTTSAIVPKPASSLSSAPAASVAAPMTPAAVAKPSQSLPVGSEFSPPPSPSSPDQSLVMKEKKAPLPTGRWAVQIQATTQEEAAQNTAKLLREQGLSPVVSRIERQGEVWYRVRVGKFANEEEARAVVSRFRREGKFSQAYPVLE
jgi:septal ring-binding cell division protein DamX